MIFKRILFPIGILSLLILTFSPGCTKSKDPKPPVADTTVNLTKGLLLYLPFSGNIADSSGNGNKFYSIYEKFHKDLKTGEKDSITVENIGGTECQKCHY